MSWCVLVMSGRSPKVGAKMKSCKKNDHKAPHSIFGVDSSWSSWLWVPGADAPSTALTSQSFLQA